MRRRRSRDDARSLFALQAFNVTRNRIDITFAQWRGVELRHWRFRVFDPCEQRRPVPEQRRVLNIGSARQSALAMHAVAGRAELGKQTPPARGTGDAGLAFGMLHDQICSLIIRRKPGGHDDDLRRAAVAECEAADIARRGGNILFPSYLIGDNSTRKRVTVWLIEKDLAGGRVENQKIAAKVARKDEAAASGRDAGDDGRG